MIVFVHGKKYNSKPYILDPFSKVVLLNKNGEELRTEYRSNLTFDSAKKEKRKRT